MHARDATKEREADEALQRAHAELEARVLERTSQLQAEVKQRVEAERAHQKLLQQLITAQEDERRRLSRELHDQLGQHLSALSLGLKSLQNQEESLPQGERRQAAAQIEQLRHRTEEIMQQAHRLAWELRPSVLDDWGLHTAIDLYTAHWTRHSNVPVDFHSIGFMETGTEQRIAPEIESTLYRIAQEALTNIERHAEATTVSVLLEKRATEVRLIVEDNGRGFDVEAQQRLPAHQRRLGLQGMQERVALVGGTLTIESVPELGTTVFAIIPLSGDNQ